jgi:hypothetical protein
MALRSNKQKFNRPHKDQSRRPFSVREGRLEIHNWQLNAGVGQGIPRESQPRPSCDLLNLSLDTHHKLTTALNCASNTPRLFVVVLLFAAFELLHLHAPAPCPMNAYSNNKLNRAQPHHGDRLCRVIRRGHSRCRVLSTKDPGVFEDSFG